MNEYLHTFLMCKVRKESHVPLDKYISLNMVENFVMTWNYAWNYACRTFYP